MSKCNRTRRPRVAAGANVLGLDAAIDALRRNMLTVALQENATLVQAARQLQISLRRLHYLIVSLGIQRRVTVTRTVEVSVKK
jgi:transcriptional regulator with GAF, ATPase, and Fis domain